MDDKEFSPDLLFNRRTATALHNRLRAEKSPMLQLGRFYNAMLNRGVWDSQKAMAEDLGVSPATLSKTIASARLPVEVLRVFGSRPIGFRNLSSLNLLVKQVGEAEIIRRALSIPPGTLTDEIFAVLTTGKKPSRMRVRVSISANAEYLRVDVPNMALVAPRVKELEELLNAMLGSAVSEPRR